MRKWSLVLLASVCLVLVLGQVGMGSLITPAGAGAFLNTGLMEWGASSAWNSADEAAVGQTATDANVAKKVSPSAFAAAEDLVGGSAAGKDGGVSGVVRHDGKKPTAVENGEGRGTGVDVFRTPELRNVVPESELSESLSMRRENPQE